MKNLIYISLFLGVSAQADIIKCGFTEPFINTTYSMAAQTLTYVSFDSKTTVLKNVSFQIKTAGTFELVAKNGKVLQVLKLTNNGSDGMSDMVYPYDVKDFTIGDSSANNGIGGCSSNFLKVKKGQN
ncbi:MAG: hypothetical protein H7061_06645 [Bdellovibrionaceae bacterium]|nr:hypothetical protein [Bdellovibrio sp.]